MQILDDLYKEEVQYKEEVRARWGDTDAYREYTEKQKAAVRTNGTPLPTA